MDMFLCLFSFKAIITICVDISFYTETFYTLNVPKWYNKLVGTNIICEAARFVWIVKVEPKE